MTTGFWIVSRGSGVTAGTGRAHRNFGGIIGSTAVWRKSSEIAEVAHSGVDRVALLHLEATQPVVLEGPAAKIWAFIDGTSSEDDIAEQLATHYGQPKALLAAQLGDFLTSLAQQKFIEPVLQTK